MKNKFLVLALGLSFVVRPEENVDEQPTIQFHYMGKDGHGNENKAAIVIHDPKQTTQPFSLKVVDVNKSAIEEHDGKKYSMNSEGWKTLEKEYKLNAPKEEKPKIEPTIQYTNMYSNPEQTGEPVGGMIVLCNPEGEFSLSMKVVNSPEARKYEGKAYKKGSEGWEALNEFFNSVKY